MTLLISKTCNRITLGGGGCDISSFYKKTGHGMWVSGAIDKFIYVTLKERAEKEFRIVYRKVEEVSKVEDIQHPIICEALKTTALNGHLEITCQSDLPSQSGLGSSGAFTVGLFAVLWNHLAHMGDKDFYLLKGEEYQQSLAKEAYHLEHDILHRPIGWQDSYIASFGGMRRFYIDSDEHITQREMSLSSAAKLERHLSLFNTGQYRQAEEILQSQQSSEKYYQAMQKIYEIGKESIAAIDHRDIETFGRLLDKHWQVKLSSSPEMSSPQINGMCEWAKSHGALGGKLIGAGGGGFLMFCSLDKEKFDKDFTKKFKLPLTPFKFWWKGSEVFQI